MTQKPARLRKTGQVWSSPLAETFHVSAKYLTQGDGSPSSFPDRPFTAS
jgi:hypothetical protein